MKVDQSVENCWNSIRIEVTTPTFRDGSFDFEARWSLPVWQINGKIVVDGT